MMLDDLNKEQAQLWLNVDVNKRTVDEWFEKYHFLHKTSYKKLCTEFELAYDIDDYDYWFDLKNSEQCEEYDLRLHLIQSLIYQLADKDEKKVLNNKYMETAAIKAIILGRW